MWTFSLEFKQLSSFGSTEKIANWPLTKCKCSITNTAVKSQFLILRKHTQQGAVWASIRANEPHDSSPALFLLMLFAYVGHVILQEKYKSP